MTLFQLARISAVTALVLMLAGHLGAAPLDWTRDPISTYAARAPLDFLVSAAMMLSALAGIFTALACSASAGPENPLTRLLPVISGAAAGGLFLVAAFEEPFSFRRDPGAPTAGQVRIQGFHDAGLVLFVAASLALLLLLGIHWIRSAPARNRWIGVAPVLAAVLSQAVRLPMVIPPSLYGLSQRLSLFCLWLGIAAAAFAFPGASVPRRRRTKR
jgi:hypothetical protein